MTETAALAYDDLAEGALVDVSIRCAVVTARYMQVVSIDGKWAPMVDLQLGCAPLRLVPTDDPNLTITPYEADAGGPSAELARRIAAELVEQADDEALRPTRDSVSRAIEQTLRDAAETALRVAGLAEEEDEDG